jgi:phosphohistidine phosphatase
MKSIMLMRHAKSSRDSAGKDFDRPLAERGKEDVSRMGVFIKGVKASPGYIMSSPAKRTKQTVRLFTKTAGIGSSLINWNKDFYSGGTEDYLAAIQEAPDKTDNILLVGHNPLLEETVSLLCNKEGIYTVRMPTGSLVCIEHPAIKWKQVKSGTARIKWMIIPELLNK